MYSHVTVIIVAELFFCLKTTLDYLLTVKIESFVCLTEWVVKNSYLILKRAVRLRRPLEVQLTAWTALQEASPPGKFPYKKTRVFDGNFEKNP